MKELNYYKKLTYAFYILIELTTIYDLVARGGEKIPRIILLTVTIFGISIVFPKTFLKNSKITYSVIMFFLFISIYLANIFNFYGLPYYDKFLHLFSGVILGFIGLVVYMYMFEIKEKADIKVGKLIVFVIMFLAATACLWEMWEFTTDTLFNLTAQNGLIDTMWDMILGTVGGIFVVIPVAKTINGKNRKLVEKLISEISR